MWPNFTLRNRIKNNYKSFLDVQGRYLIVCPPRVVLWPFLLAIMPENTLFHAALIPSSIRVHRLSHSTVHMESIKADDSRLSASLCFTLTLSCFPEEGDYRFQIEVVSHSVLTCPEIFPRAPPYLTRPQPDCESELMSRSCDNPKTVHFSELTRSSGSDPHPWPAPRFLLS